MGKKISIYIENDKMINAVKQAARKKKLSMTKHIEDLLEKDLVAMKIEDENTERVDWWNTDEYKW